MTIETHTRGRVRIGSDLHEGIIRITDPSIWDTCTWRIYLPRPRLQLQRDTIVHIVVEWPSIERCVTGRARVTHSTTRLIELVLERPDRVVEHRYILLEPDPEQDRPE